MIAVLGAARTGLRGGRHVRGEGSQLEAAIDACHDLTKLHNDDSHA